MCLVTLTGKLIMPVCHLFVEKDTLPSSLQWICLILHAVFLAHHDLAESNNLEGVMFAYCCIFYS